MEGKEYSFNDRVKMFLEETNQGKFVNKKYIFPDRMTMCSWFKYNENKILYSKKPECVSIKEQYVKFLEERGVDTSYLDKPPEVKKTIIDIKKEYETKKPKPKKKTGFYKLFPGYTIDEINKVFNKLNDNQKQVILKRHDNDLYEDAERGILSPTERAHYAKVKNKIQKILEGKSGTLDDEIKIPINTESDSNESYLKLYELLNTKYFQEYIMGMKPEDAMIILIKLKNPIRTNNEIASFLNISLEKVDDILSNGLGNIKDELNNLFNEAFGIYTDNDLDVKKKSK